ncbi:MAG TPA: hypothetical protein VLB86_04105 [Gaiellaceae bacterium]|nr:hypothetical protein [Gaiellaceae bacterium]
MEYDTEARRLLADERCATLAQEARRVHTGRGRRSRRALPWRRLRPRTSPAEAGARRPAPSP